MAHSLDQQVIVITGASSVAEDPKLPTPMIERGRSTRPGRPDASTAGAPGPSTEAWRGL